MAKGYGAATAKTGCFARTSSGSRVVVIPMRLTTTVLGSTIRSVRPASRPTIFISSTIRDFEDLRSSLKFWLEEFGFDVWLSEYNDMEKSPGANTFDACFEAIGKAGFYILLIGDRRGSLYDDVEGVSVTQREYRAAYSAFASEGLPIPILFIRSRTKDLLDAWIKTGKTGPPPFEDAPFVGQFVGEVTKEQETTAAVKGVGPYPLANWLHPFHDLGDIVRALRVALSLRVDVPIQRVLASIEVDLEVSLSQLVRKHRRKFEEGDPIRDQLKKLLLDSGHGEEAVGAALDRYEQDWPFPHHWYLNSVTREVPLDPDGKSPVNLNREQTLRLSIYFVGIAVPEGLWFNSLREAVHTGLLLRYDPRARRFEETELSSAAIELLGVAESYRSRHHMFEQVRDALFEPLRAAHRLKEPTFVLSWEQALVIWGLHQMEVNLYRRAGSIYAYLRGEKESPLPDVLLPTTPLGPEMEEKIRRERAGRVDIREWSKISGFWNQ